MHSGALRRYLVIRFSLGRDRLEYMPLKTNKAKNNQVENIDDWIGRDNVIQM
jgi:hypothetical protein